VPTKKQVLIYLKGAVPSVIKEFFNLMSFALKLIVSGEILANVYRSVGGNIQQASIYSDTVLLTALTLFVCVLGIVLEVVGNLISTKLGDKYL
jgi:ABC-type nitrate/sulfonate/bicarbonate transport system permease component